MRPKFSRISSFQGPRTIVAAYWYGPRTPGLILGMSDHIVLTFSVHRVVVQGLSLAARAERLLHWHLEEFRSQHWHYF